ncbi:hypothetical protein VT25_14775 [Photobacterium leiognathi subsp. mandapamensis]|nr:hypothetical protein VT25_14775 [Photobacterium leiognathi subsp. mandapamensis]
MDEDLGSFSRVFSLFDLLDEYHEKQLLDNNQYKNKSEEELSSYITSAETSMAKMGYYYDYHNYDPGVERELRLEVMAANAQYEFFEEAREIHSLAIVQMKILFLYKEVEIRFKQLLSSRYNVNTKRLPNLDSWVASFKDHSVDIAKLEGFEQIRALKQVNNDLKHSLSIHKSRRIDEFKDKHSFDSVSLEQFFQRISHDVEEYFCQLLKCVDGYDQLDSCNDVDISGDIPF